VVVIVVAWAAVVGLRMLHAVHQLEAGVTSAEAVRANLSTTDIEDGMAAPRLAEASAEFTDAHHEIDSPWMAPLHLLPYLGRQVRAADDLSGAAATVTTAGHTALLNVESVLTRPHASAPARAAAVNRLATTLSSLDRKVTGVDLGPSKDLLPTLAAKRNTFASDLVQLDAGLGKGTGAVDAVADLLDNHRTYLILSANNAEMRDGQGTPLQVGTVTSTGGQLTLGHFSATATLAGTKAAVPVAGELARLFPGRSLGSDYRNLGLSPQYELNAPTAAEMWRAQTGQAVAGVITIDVVALKDLLAVTGPVTVGGVTVNENNVEQDLFLTQYIGDTGNAANAARREAEGALAAAVFDAIQRPGLSLTGLATALDSAVNGRHLLAWSSVPAVESDWQASGAGGQLQRDDVLLGVSNLGPTKLDPYLVVKADLTLTPSSTASASATTRVTLTATFDDQAPTGLPLYVAGEGPGQPAPGTYTGLVTLDVPQSATGIEVKGAPLNSRGPDGPSNLDAVGIRLARGQSITVTWSFSLPGRRGSLRIDSSARVPPVSWTTPRLSFTDDATHTIAW
jgi:hypothetical protein